MSRTSTSPSGSRQTLKRSAVVAIGIDRHQVGTDNGTRWQAEGGDIPNFAKEVPKITHLGEAPASPPLLWFSETRDVSSGTPGRMGKEPQAP